MHLRHSCNEAASRVRRLGDLDVPAAGSSGHTGSESVTGMVARETGNRSPALHSGTAVQRDAPDEVRDGRAAADLAGNLGVVVQPRDALGVREAPPQAAWSLEELPRSGQLRWDLACRAAIGSGLGLGRPRFYGPHDRGGGPSMMGDERRWAT